MLNKFQKAAAANYADGDFAHITSIEDASTVGDTLFLFIMRELADDGEPMTQAEAQRRMARAMDDIGDVEMAVCADELEG